MRTFLRAVLFAATFLPCAPPFAGACGDKLLVLGRGVKFGNINSSYHASIIAYVPDSVPQSAAVNDPHFQVALQKAGHKLLLVHQADVLADRIGGAPIAARGFSADERDGPFVRGIASRQITSAEQRNLHGAAICGRDAR